MNNHIAMQRRIYICPECEVNNVRSMTLPDGKKVCPCNFYSQMQLSHLMRRRRKPKDDLEFSKCKHYEVTLTTKPEPEADFNVVTKLLKFLNSKQFKPTHGWTACLEHATTNAHVHISVHTTKYMPIRDLLKLNKQQRVSVTLLKTSVDLDRWDRYVSKMEADKYFFNTKTEIQAWLDNYHVKTIETLDFE